MTDPSPPSPQHHAPPATGWLYRHARRLVWGYWACLLAATHFPQFDPEPPDPMGPLDPVLRPDKLVHFCAFAGLMLMLVLSGLGGRGRPWPARCRVALAIALAYATIDETTQRFIPGRDSGLSDLLANALGILSVYVLALLPPLQQRGSRPKALAWTLGVLTPVFIVSLLSPWVMRQASDLVRSLGVKPAGASYRLDHITHGLIALIVSVLLIVVWPMASRYPRRAGLISIALLLLAGPAAEIAQHYTGRGVEARDVLAHSIGVGVALAWWAVCLTRSPRLRSSPPATLADPA